MLPRDHLQEAMGRQGVGNKDETVMRFDRTAYFNSVRNGLFEGAVEQVHVDGQNLILGTFENQYGGTPMDDVRWLAYMLATVFHETGYQMWPNTEQGSQEYLQSKSYYPYIGRGYVHLTWEDNYRSASAKLGLVDDRDLVVHPELALDSLIATRVMFRGMAEGWFTGAKLGQFFDDETDNPYDARTIINGHDKASEIAAYHDQFLTALQESMVE